MRYVLDRGDNKAICFRDPACEVLLPSAYVVKYGSQWFLVTPKTAWGCSSRKYPRCSTARDIGGQVPSRAVHLDPSPPPYLTSFGDVYVCRPSSCARCVRYNQRRICRGQLLDCFYIKRGILLRYFLKRKAQHHRNVAALFWCGVQVTLESCAPSSQSICFLDLFRVQAVACFSKFWPHLSVGVEKGAAKAHPGLDVVSDRVKNRTWSTPLLLL